MILPHASPEEALAAVAAGGTIVLPRGPVPADGTQSTDAQAVGRAEVGAFCRGCVCEGREEVEDPGGQGWGDAIHLSHVATLGHDLRNLLEHSGPAPRAAPAPSRPLL